MPELKYGLNLTKKSALPPLSHRAPPKRTIFDEDESPDEDAGKQNGPQAVSTFGALGQPTSNPAKSRQISKSAPRPPSGPPQRKKAQSSQYGDLSAHHASMKHAEEAQDVDPSVYDYDAVYDSIHSKPDKSKAHGKDTGPKYMGSLLVAAEVRKRDQLRAKEKALQREREEEGEEFADKERFVTSAYKAQQAEMRKVEGEERLREAAEMEKRRKHGGGMTGLYKDLLSREDERHEQAMKAVEDLSKQGGVQAQAQERTDGKDDVALAKERGAVVNEDGQIVDKRQLLSAGLNVTRKTTIEEPQDRRRDGNGDRFQQKSAYGKLDAKKAMRERQTQMLEAQLEDASKRAAQDEETDSEALERANKRRATETDVNSAKERYLARKRAAEAAKQEAA